MLNAKSSLLWKKRNLVAISLLIWLIFSVVSSFVTQRQEKPQSVGVLLLPGDGILNYEFTMPVDGAFRVLLQTISDGNIKTVAGTSFDESMCPPFGPKPERDIEEYIENPMTSETSKAVRRFNTIKEKCVLFSRFGVVRFELKHSADNSLIQARYSPNMHHLWSKLGTPVADFRLFEKGTQLTLNVTSFLSDSLKEREQIPYKIFIKPIRIRCLLPRKNKDDKLVACGSGR